jgi:hypothetical protein
MKKIVLLLTILLISATNSIAQEISKKDVVTKKVLHLKTKKQTRKLESLKTVHNVEPSNKTNEIITDDANKKKQLEEKMKGHDKIDLSKKAEVKQSSVEILESPEKPQ